MGRDWKGALERWVGAGLIEASAAERIRAFEARREEPQKLRWPVRVAIGFGGVLLAAGVLLFVEAHWDELSPAQRFALVLAMVALFHVAGAMLAGRFRAMATVLHAVGTASLGAGIFLSGQIFNLEEHWPGAFMMWALGAWLGFLLFRNWPQAAFAAVLTPVWLAGEWAVATEQYSGAEHISNAGVLLLAITYFTSALREKPDTIRRALTWIGGIAVIPCVFVATEMGSAWWGNRQQAPGSLRALGWALTLALPLVLAAFLRRREAWTNLAAAVWVVALVNLGRYSSEAGREALYSYLWRGFGVYLWCALGAMGMIAWGLYEARKERINLGMVGLAITVLTFYFSSVVDKLGRATSMMSLGLLFLLLGWVLEKTRRRLLARLERTAA